VLSTHVSRVIREPPHTMLRMRSTPGADTAHFIYGTDPHTPDMMVYDDCSNGVTSSDVYRLLRDERGSVRLVIRVTNGEVIQRVDYGPWGEPTRVLPSSSVSTMVVQPFGFAGGIWMPEAQLWHFGARDLDPTTGRWTTKDPILFEGGYNLYMYVTNDPVNWVDHEGREPVTVGALVALAAGGAVLAGGGYLLGAYLSGSEWTAGGLLAASAGGALASLALPVTGLTALSAAVGGG